MLELILTFIVILTVIPVLIYSIIQLIRDPSIFYGLLTVCGCFVLIDFLLTAYYIMFLNINNPGGFGLFLFWTIDLLVYSGAFGVLFIKKEVNQ